MNFACGSAFFIPPLSVPYNPSAMHFRLGKRIASRRSKGYNESCEERSEEQSSMILRIGPEDAAFAAERDKARALREAIAPRGLGYHIETYGCQMNARDSETLAGMLQEMGFQPARCKEEAKLLLFNTCCVREHAEKRVFGNIGALKKRKNAEPDLLIGVCGCMMQQRETAERLYRRFPFVDLVFGTHSLRELPSLMERALRGERPLSVHEVEGDVVEGLPAEREAGVSASVNIMYGCDNFCSYCIVPFVRGRERSRLPEEIVAEVEGLTARGMSEILLLGQNVNSYGKHVPGCSFPELLRRLDPIPGLRRLRFMTSHPKDLSPALIDAMAELPRVCNHIHLPVQAGNDRILAAMNRQYTRAEYLSLVRRLREKVPGIELTTDVIVGFPGETEAEFQDTLSLMEEVGFSAAFTFLYSPRAGTKAATMPEQIDEACKKDRLFRLNALQEQKTRESNLRYIGQAGEVLIEGFDARQGLAYGKLRNFKMVYFPGDPSMIGAYRAVRIEKAERNSLIGRLEK